MFTWLASWFWLLVPLHLDILWDTLGFLTEWWLGFKSKYSKIIEKWKLPVIYIMLCSNSYKSSRGYRLHLSISGISKNFGTKFPHGPKQMWNLGDRIMNLIAWMTQDLIKRYLRPSLETQWSVVCLDAQRGSIHALFPRYRTHPFVPWSCKEMHMIFLVMREGPDH